MARDETAREPDTKSLLDRRSYLKLAGAAVASVGTLGTSTAAAQDDNILFEEQFASSDYADRFSDTWVQGEYDGITTEDAYSNDSCLRVDIPEGKHHGMNATIDPKDAGLIDENLQELYVSYWVKFSPDFESDNNGGKIPGPRNRERSSGGGAGTPCDGTNGWSSLAKFDENGGQIGVGYYTYHMDMSGDWGDHLNATTVPRDEWVKIEQYVKLNTVTNGSANRDGELKMWVNGDLYIDRTSMRFTLYPENGINYGTLIYYGGSSPSPADNYICIDNWTVARSRPSDDQETPEGSVLELVSGEGTDVSEYQFTVDGTVQKRTGVGKVSAENNDTITDNGDGTVTVTGETGNGYGDSFLVDGTITSMSDLDESKWTIRYEGEEVSLKDLVQSGPSIDRFDVTKSEQLGTDRMFSVQWAVSDADDGLDSVEIVVVKDVADINFSVTQASGESASGWDLFQFPSGSELDVNLHAEDAAGNVTKQTETITL